MKPLSNFVSLHPYFKVHSGKMEELKAALPAFVEPPSPEMLRRAEEDGDTMWKRGWIRLRRGCGVTSLRARLRLGKQGDKTT